MSTRAVAALAAILGLAGPAAAQTPTPTPAPAPQTIAPLAVAPIPFLVLDARGGFASLGADASTAAGLNIPAASMPSRARTAVAGVHLYLKRRGGFKLGFGAEVLRGAGSSQQTDAAGKAFGPVFHRRLNYVSGQVSLNFGRGKGWSYITVGGGPMRFDSYRDEANPTRAGETAMNFGGGARWFGRGHLALTVDLRFYLTPPADAGPDVAARVRKRLSLLSVGISLK